MHNANECNFNTQNFHKITKILKRQTEKRKEIFREKREIFFDEGKIRFSFRKIKEKIKMESKKKGKRDPLLHC